METYCPIFTSKLTIDVKTVSKFAQLEFKCGSPEHGRTIMTGLVANYPRRFDIWNIFLDLEIKQNDPAVIRYVLRYHLRLIVQAAIPACIGTENVDEEGEILLQEVAAMGDRTWQCGRR